MRRLTEEAQELAEIFQSRFEDEGRGCTCFISAPCSRCCHEGNHITEQDESWVGESHVSSYSKIKQALQSAKCLDCSGDGFSLDGLGQQIPCEKCRTTGLTDAAIIDLVITESIIEESTISN